jgi:hypothetical protein
MLDKHIRRHMGNAETAGAHGAGLLTSVKPPIIARQQQSSVDDSVHEGETRS